MALPPNPPAIIEPSYSEPAERLAVVEITIQDGLAIGDFLSPGAAPLTIFVQAPADLVPEGQLSFKHKSELLKHLYGASWEYGNEDGSKYVVMSYSSVLLPSDLATSGAWRTTPGAWLYQIGLDGSVQKLGDGYVSK